MYYGVFSFNRLWKSVIKCDIISIVKSEKENFYEHYLH